MIQKFELCTYVNILENIFDSIHILSDILNFSLSIPVRYLRIIQMILESVAD